MSLDVAKYVCCNTPHSIKQTTNYMSFWLLSSVHYCEQTIYVHVDKGFVLKLSTLEIQL